MHGKLAGAPVRHAAALLGVLTLAGGCTFIERVNLTSDEAPGDGSVIGHVSVSSDGRYVTFAAGGTPLVDGVAATGVTHVYVRDMLNRTTELIDQSTGGVAGDSTALYPSISADGRYVAFESDAQNLVPGDTNWSTDVFVRDRTAGTTERSSVASDGSEGDSDSVDPSISDDGARVAFTSSAENLVTDDTNGADDVFVRDGAAGTTVRASVKSNGDEGDELEDSYDARISGDGTVVAFATYEPFVGDDDNWEEDVYVRELTTSKTKLVSRHNNDSVTTNGGSGPPAISSDGRYVAFISFGNPDGAGGSPVALNIFMRDRTDGTTTRVSITPTAVQADGHSIFPTMSSDGRYVAFRSEASNLITGDTNGVDDIFVRDRTEARTWRVSTDAMVAQAAGFSYDSAISRDGNLVAFTTVAELLALYGEPPGNGVVDVYLRKVRVPQVGGISPPSIARGSSVPVTITGTDFEAGAVLSLPSGVTASGVTVVDSTQITATLAVAAGAATGTATVYVQNPGPAWQPLDMSMGQCACLTIT